MTDRRRNALYGGLAALGLGLAVAAAVALGVMLALGLGAMGVPDGKITPPGAQGPLSGGSHALDQLAALNLPGFCFEARGDAVGTINVDAVTPAPVDRRKFQCCARCHAEGRARLAWPLTGRRRMLHSCVRRRSINGLSGDCA